MTVDSGSALPVAIATPTGITTALYGGEFHLNTNYLFVEQTGHWFCVNPSNIIYSNANNNISGNNTISGTNTFSGANTFNQTNTFTQPQNIPAVTATVGITNTTHQNIPTSSGAPLTLFNNVINDPYGLWSNSGQVFTAPFNGNFALFCNINVDNATTTPTNPHFIELYKNGGLLIKLDTQAANGTSISLNGYYIDQANAGDTYYIQFHNGDPTNTAIIGTQDNDMFFGIKFEGT